MKNNQQHPASFRDPSGFIFTYEGKFYRQVNRVYAADYAFFKKSGLFDLLVKQKKILSHTELDTNFTGSPEWHCTLLPEQLGFIAYPYEWCFGQWKDAALLTLDLVKTAIVHGMVLKDATPFNIQFVNGAPVFIDTLSFEKYEAAKPWVAYRQFAECFLAPMLLARYHGQEMLKLFQVYPDGIPLPLVSKLLPLKSLLNANVFLHIKLPGLLGTGKKQTAQKQAPFTQQKLLNIISNLHSFVSNLSLPNAVTQWNNYYEETILSKEYAAAKMLVIADWLKEIPGETVLDIGTNTGRFAMAAAAAGKFTIATDGDAACIEQLYHECRKKKIQNLLPICIDITNPSPAIGWNNAERNSFAGRIRADITLALALIHHLAIGKNISFEQMAETFSSYSTYLIIEFVPKSDEKTQLLLQHREDIFSNYNELFFVETFEKRFTLVDKASVPGTERVIFLMKRNTPLPVKDKAGINL